MRYILGSVFYVYGRYCFWAVLVVLLILASVLARRVRRRSVAVQVGERVYAELHDQIGACFTDLARLVRQNSPEAELLRPTVGETIATVRNLLDSANDWVVPEGDLFYELNRLLLRRFCAADRGGVCA